jgi:hypothetical protein
MLFNLIQDMPTLYPKEIKAFITWKIMKTGDRTIKNKDNNINIA